MKSSKAIPVICLMVVGCAALFLTQIVQAARMPGSLTLSECQELVARKVKEFKNETCPIAGNVDLVDTLYCARLVANTPTPAPTARPSQSPSRSPTKRPTLNPTRASWSWTGKLQLLRLQRGGAGTFGGGWEEIKSRCYSLYAGLDEFSDRPVFPFLAIPGGNIITYIRQVFSSFDFSRAPVQVFNRDRAKVLNDFFFFIRPENPDRTLGGYGNYLCPTSECPEQTGIWYNIEDGNNGNTPGNSEGNQDCNGWKTSDANWWTYSVLWTRQPSSRGDNSLMTEKNSEDQCNNNYYFMCFAPVMRRASDGFEAWAR